MIELKEHNIEPYNRLCEALEKNDKVGYESATGTGKSYVGGKYVEEHDLVEKTLVLVPSNAIREGWAELIPGVDTMTYQAILNFEKGLDKYNLIICDEMHHLGAEQWGQKFREMTEAFDGKILGMSATPIRFLDNSRDMIEELFSGNRVMGISLPEAIERGILPSFDYITVLYNLAGARPKDNGRKSDLTEKLYKQLDVMENEHSFRNILRKHMKYGSHKVAVFVPSIDQMDEYRSVVEATYPQATHISAHSGMKKSEIEQAFESFEHADDTCFIYTVDLLNEGVHIDGVDTVIMFRRTESPTVFLQQLGRALTTNTAGERITVFDFVANHANIQLKRDGAGSIIEWINKEVATPQRQIIKYDYAKEEREVLDQLRSLLDPSWTPDDDQVFREIYDFGKGLDQLQELYPEKTRGAIIQHAGRLGLQAKKTPKSKTLDQDIKKFYLEPNGMEKIISIHPDAKKSTIRAHAYKMGLKQKASPDMWTDEEVSVLLANSHLPTAELKSLIPGKTSTQISGKKNYLRIPNKPVKHWTEEDDEIMRANRDLSYQVLQARFFPFRTVEAVRVRGNVLGLHPLEPWNDDKKQKFIELYKNGGKEAVLRDPEFQDLTENKITGRAHSLGVKSGAVREGLWTDEEIAILREHKRNLNGKRPNIRSLVDKLPGRTYEAISRKYSIVNREATNA